MGNVIGYQVTSTLSGAYHLACVIRDCLADFGSGGLSANYIALMLGGGMMTIAESNQVRNRLIGIKCGATSVAKDIVAQNNTFTNVAKVFFG